MSKQKFKVGDRVVVTNAWDEVNGRIGTIVEIDGSRIPYRVSIDNPCNNFDKLIWAAEVKHAREKHPVIVITSDGKTTTATLRKGKKVIKTASATCSDKDTFDFSEGARIAFERLQGREPFKKEEKKQALYSGKIVCIDVKGIRVPYTVGKIYRCEKERNFNGDDSKEYCCYLGTRTDSRFRVRFSFGEAFFIPLVED